VALQVVVHEPDGMVRAVALPVTAGTEKFVTETPPRTRALLGAPLSTVACSDGDVIAINVGVWANNETRSLAPGIGLYFYANQIDDDEQPIDIAYLDTATLGNTWVEFSADLEFQP
jgi:hypothetical protein